MKVIHCAEAGFSCDAVVRAESEDEAVEKAEQHAKEVHGISPMPPEVRMKLRALVKDE
jgi:predicted small metal-binding protein